VVICGHLLPDIEEICDRIAILESGELKVLGRFEDLLVSQGETQIRTTGLDDETLAEIRAVLQRRGADVLNVEHPRMSLDDLFVRTVRESQQRPGRRFVPGEGPSPDSANGDGRGGDKPAEAKAGS
jgi:ABC-2 type transport system ATP-binding protein